MIPIIDMGHRRDTPGKRCEDLREYEFNQDVGLRAFILLSEMGYYPVITIGTEDHPYSEDTSEGRSKNLMYRCDQANKVTGKSIFLSIHANASDSAKACGFESYVYKRGGEAEKVQQIAHEVMSDILGLKDRGMKEANFCVLRETNMPAVLFEFAFFTNEAERELLHRNDFRQKCAMVVAETFRRYESMTNQLDIAKVIGGYDGDYSYVQRYKRIVTDMTNVRIMRNKKLRDGSAETVGISGTFQPNGILIDKGEIIRPAASHMWRGRRDMVFMITKSGEIKTVRAMYASEIIEEAWFAVGGASIKDMTVTHENGRKEMADYDGGFDDLYSDIWRRTKHTIIGNIGREVHLIYVWYMDGEDIKNFCEYKGLENYILLDGGHIASITSMIDKVYGGSKATLDNTICLEVV